jgi:hypothetical protein
MQCELSVVGVRNMDNEDSLCAGDVIDMVAKSYEEIEEELRSAIEHLKLHGATSFEGATTADDEGQIMCS